MALEFLGVRRKQRQLAIFPLLGRTMSESTPHPNRQVYLQTRMLTKAEMQYAFDRLLEWNGLRVEVVDEKRFRVVPLTELAKP